VRDHTRRSAKVSSTAPATRAANASKADGGAAAETVVEVEEEEEVEVGGLCTAAAIA
jgi:hypothetical protein